MGKPRDGFKGAAAGAPRIQGRTKRGQGGVGTAKSLLMWLRPEVAFKSTSALAAAAPRSRVLGYDVSANRQPTQERPRIPNSGGSTQDSTAQSKAAGRWPRTVDRGDRPSQHSKGGGGGALRRRRRIPIAAGRPGLVRIPYSRRRRKHHVVGAARGCGPSGPFCAEGTNFE